MKFNKTFSFTPPGKRLKENYKSGVDYKNVPTLTAVFAAAKGLTDDVGAIHAMELAGGKTAVLKMDKTARAEAAAKAQTRADFLNPASATGKTKSKSKPDPRLAELEAEVEELKGKLATSDTVQAELSAANAAIETLLAAVNATVPEGETPVQTLAEVAALLTGSPAEKSAK